MPETQLILQRLRDAPSIVLNLINEGSFFPLLFLIFVLIFVGQYVATEAHRHGARILAVTAFIAYCLYGFIAFQPYDAADVAWLAFRGLLASGLTYSAGLLLLPILTFCFVRPYRRMKASWKQQLYERSKRREELEKQREQERQEAEEAEQRRRYLEEHPPLSAEEIHAKQIKEAEANLARDQKMINNNLALDAAEKKRALKQAKQRYLKRLNSLIAE